MPKITVHIEPKNGLGVPEFGHLSHGEHELEVSSDQLAMLQTAEGLSIDEDTTSKTASNVTKLPTADATKPTDAELLAAEIRQAIAQLDPDDQSLWTKSSKAKTEALEVLLTYSITAAERDAAMPAS